MYHFKLADSLETGFLEEYSILQSSMFSLHLPMLPLNQHVLVPDKENIAGFFIVQKRFRIHGHLLQLL